MEMENSTEELYEIPKKKDKIPVLEIFGPTLQGEGAMIGKQTWFVRTAGCDYRCSKCDSMHAVDPKQYKGLVTYYTAAELAARLLEEMGHCIWVTISGGNPALWDFTETVKILHRAGKLVAVETQGSVYKTWLSTVDTLTVSPKGPGMGINPQQALREFREFHDQLAADRRNSPKILEYALKIPVFSTQDLDFAERFVAFFWPIYLSVGNENVPGNEVGVSLSTHRDILLEVLHDIAREVYHRPLLAQAAVLPQLHVLMYGNRQGV